MDLGAVVRRIERKRRMVERLSGQPGAANESAPSTNGNGLETAAEGPADEWEQAKQSEGTPEIDDTGPGTPTAMKRPHGARGRFGSGAASSSPPCPPLPDEQYYVRATWASFRLEGIEVEIGEVVDALAAGADRIALRSRQAARLRHHAAILRHIESDVRHGQALTPDGVLRWYTGISAGLSTTGLDASASARLDEVVRRINAAQTRVRAAIQEAAVVYGRLVSDPLVPGFNGMLARLMLRYHLGRCGLPGVVFDPAIDARPGTGEAATRRLMELVEGAYDGMLGRR